MGTIIDRLEIAQGGWRSRHSALHLAVSAAKSCLHEARRDADDVDLLVNAGIYRDRNLGEPALAALIQEDIGAPIPKIRTATRTALSRSTSPTVPAEF
jgi:3-oxoacyl-[acyl-carrier-protein] synthase-3